jgi:hypothetical protein
MPGKISLDKGASPKPVLPKPTAAIRLPASGRLPPEVLSRLTDAINNYFRAVNLLPDAALKTSLLQRLEIHRLELTLLKAKSEQQEPSGSGQLASIDVYKSFANGLIGIRTEVLAALGFTDLSPPPAFESAKVGFLTLSPKNLALAMLMQQGTAQEKELDQLVTDIDKYAEDRLSPAWRKEIHALLASIDKQEIKDLSSLLDRYKAAQTHCQIVALLEEELPFNLEIEQPPAPSVPVICPPVTPPPPPTPSAGKLSARVEKIKQSTRFKAWESELDQDQLNALDYLISLDSGDIFDRIFATDEMMNKPFEKDIPIINFVLTAAATLLEQKISGLPTCLERLAGITQGGTRREVSFTLGSAYKLIRLGDIAELSDLKAPPLTSVAQLLGEIDYFPDGSNQKTRQAIEADGYRRSSKTLLELKFSRERLAFGPDKSGDSTIPRQISNMKNKARKYGEAVKKGVISQVEYHITTPEIDPKLVSYLKRWIDRVAIYHYRDLFEVVPQQMAITGAASTASERPVVNKPLPARARDWDEAAWVWSQRLFTGSKKKERIKPVKDFSGKPHNVVIAFRQAHYRDILNGLQAQLDIILENTGLSAADRETALTLKREISQTWRQRLDKNSVGDTTIREFSFVLRQVIALLERATLT